MKATEPDFFTLSQIVKCHFMIGERNDMEITIIVREKDNEYLSVLDRSILDLKAGKDLITFTMEEFMENPLYK